MANNLKSRIEGHVQEVVPVIANTLGQILNREFELHADFSPDSDVTNIIKNEVYPRVAVSFRSGSDERAVRNVMLLEPEFVLKFYAWMLMDEPAEELTSDHFDGLREGLEQLFGQIKMAVPDETGVFVVSDLDVAYAEDFGAIEPQTPEGEGVLGTLSLSSDGDAFTIAHYFWPEHPEQFAEKGSKPKAKTEAAPVNISNAQFGEIDYAGSTPGDPGNVSMLLDVELEIRVEIDRKRILVSDLLKLGKGSIVELEKSAGEPLDIFVNGRKFAEGEVVVIDDKFGIRITQLLSPKDRMKSLGKAV